MNVDNGHLIRLQYGASTPDGYELVPNSLTTAANSELGDRNETFVNLKSHTPLSKWAKEKRRAQRKAAKKSRRINRKG